MRYRDYVARIEYDDEAGILHGQVINIPDVITFQGTSVDELRQAFQDSVEDYVAFCAERGEEPEKPYSGKFSARVSPELHRKISLAAAAQSKSLNSWLNEALEYICTHQHFPPNLTVSNVPPWVAYSKMAFQKLTSCINEIQADVEQVSDHFGVIGFGTLHEPSYEYGNRDFVIIKGVTTGIGVVGVHDANMIATGTSTDLIYRPSRRRSPLHG